MIRRLDKSFKITLEKGFTIHIDTKNYLFSENIFLERKDLAIAHAIYSAHS